MPLKKRSKIAALAEEIDALREQIAGLQSAGAAQRRPKRTARRTPGSKKRTRRKKLPSRKPSKTSLATIPSSKRELEGHPSSAAPVYELQEIRPTPFSPPKWNPTHVEQSKGGPLGDLLEHVRLYWLAGDWSSLEGLDVQHLNHHPDRARICALITSALLQQGKKDQARSLVQLARSWGCADEFLCMTLAAGASRNLAQAHLLSGRGNKASEALATGFGNAGLTKKLASLLLSDTAAATVSAADARPTERGHPAAESPLAMLHTLSSHRVRRPASASPEARARNLNANGEQLYQAAHYKLAAEYFQRALNLQLRDAWICQNLAEAVARLDPPRATQWECTELGDAIAAAGKWEVAVRYYRKALQLSTSTVEAHRQAQTFQLEQRHEGHISDPIFVVGCGHSGTSLMLAMLGSHPKLHPIPKETALFLRTDQAAQGAMREFDAATKRSGKERWVEKSPPHIFQIHRFLAMRPDSRFVVMLRDGRDVVCSLKKREGYLSIADRVDRWVYDNVAADAYRQHPQVTFVKYEDLVTDTENTLRQLCAFLGIEFSDSLMRFHETPRRWYSDYIAKPAAITSQQQHNSNRNWQINQPLFDGRARWQHEMSAEEIECFKASPAQDLLVRLGYADNAEWWPGSKHSRLPAVLRAERFATNPLITPASSSVIGDNINGPSVIRVPPWLPSPLGKFYMYFGHHRGDHIRLAYADAVEGPWHIHEKGSLSLEDAPAFRDHLASPDVHIDDENKQIRMYFHGPARNRAGQWTGVATSADGLHFSASEALLGPPYFRCWNWQGAWYAVAKRNNEGWGDLLRSGNGLTEFEHKRNFLPRMRHAAVCIIEANRLLVVYSRVGDSPEHLLYSLVDMGAKEWVNWDPTAPRDLLEPSLPYEGVTYPVTPSDHGPATRVRQLRDPALLVDHGLVLFYTVAGESGIAGARLLSS